MADCGAELVQDVNLPHLRSDASVLLYEFKMCLNAYLSSNPHLRCRSLKDMIDYYGAHPQEGLKYGMSIGHAPMDASGVRITACIQGRIFVI